MDLLDEAGEIRQVYVELAQSGGPSVQTDLNEHLEAYIPKLTEIVMSLGNEQSLQAVISAEDALSTQLQAVASFWNWLRQNQIIQFGEREPQQAETKLPPVPSEEITGKTVFTYLVQLRSWTQEAADDLWGDDIPFELPGVGERYALGDFEQTVSLVQVFREGHTLRSTWIQVADCGAYWDSVSIGASRAKLLFKAKELIERILNPISFGPLQLMGMG
jgi:hypothetical protein